MRFLLLFLFVGLFFSEGYAQQTLYPSKDNTLFETADGDRSNGAGEHLFVGMSGALQDRRFRTLLAFDVAGTVPAGTVLDSVQLRLTVTRTIAGAQNVQVHRLLADWGEGASVAPGNQGGGARPDTDDATWLHTFFDTAFWQTPGGDFVPDVSAEQLVGDDGAYVWSSAALTADVQAWLDDPVGNFGWILVGNEGEETTAKRFGSREQAAEVNRPQLVLYYDNATTTDEQPGRRTARLSGNYPNPFSTQTTLTVLLDQPQPVTLTVFDLLGREVTTLLDGVYPGTQQVVFDTAALPAGIYVARLQTAEGFDTQVLVRH